MSSFPQELTDVAHALVEHCRTGQEMTGLDLLYDPEAESVEALPLAGRETGMVKGVQAIKDKHHWWSSAFEVHGSIVEGPYLHGLNRFALVFSMEATERATGNRTLMREVAIYTVEAGKIIREEFFYSAT